MGDFKGQSTDSEYFLMENLDKQDDEIIKVNSLDECPHLVAGTCWHFAPRNWS